MAKDDTSKKPGVWMLSRSVNDYNQHGDYACCVWPGKPTIEQLAEYFRYTTGQPGNVMAAVAFLLHVQNGGGRQEREDQWYELAFVEFGARINDSRA